MVLGADAGQVSQQVFEDLMIALESQELGQNVSEMDAGVGQSSAQIVKNPQGALSTAVISIRSNQVNTLVVRGLASVATPSFDTLGWNLDLAASADLTVVYALDAAGMSAALIEQEIRTFAARAAAHHATVAAVVLSGARGVDVEVNDVTVLQAPVSADDVEKLTEAEPGAVTPLAFQGQLLERAGANRKRIVLPEPEDDRILTATAELLSQGVADIILVGDKATIDAQAQSLGLDVSGATVVATSDAELAGKYAQELAKIRASKGMTVEQAAKIVEDPTYFATMMVQMGDADGMVSGATHTTADTIRPAFQIIKTAPGTNLVSSAFIMLMADRAMVFGDCAVVLSPDAQQLSQIALSSAKTAQAFGIDPKVALLSYSTKGSGSGPSVDVVTEATKLAQEAAPSLNIDGPLQFDAAVDAATGASKAPGSNVAGQANVLIFPDLNSGNIAYKTAQRIGGAIAVGPILQGLRKPINDLSRGAKVEDIVNTVAITAVQAQAEETN